MSSSLKRLGAVVIFSLGLGLLITWVSGGTSNDPNPAPASTTTVAPTTTSPSPASTTTLATTTTVAPATTTTSTPVRQLSVLQLVVGDCVVDELAAADDIAELGVVDCGQPHRSEVYAVITDPAPDTTPWPGADVLVEVSATGCLAEFEPYVGRNFEASKLDILTVLPTAETWPEGDRDILCIATRLDGADLNDSVRASGL